MTIDRDELRRKAGEIAAAYGRIDCTEKDVANAVPALLDELAKVKAERDALRQRVADVQRRADPSGTCTYDDCDRPATDFAVGREEGHCEVAAYCKDHATMLADEGDPECHECCPNCGCRFGVN